MGVSEALSSLSDQTISSFSVPTSPEVCRSDFFRMYMTLLSRVQHDFTQCDFSAAKEDLFVFGCFISLGADLRLISHSMYVVMLAAVDELFRLVEVYT